MKATLFVQSVPMSGGYEVRLTLYGHAAGEVADIMPSDPARSKWVSFGSDGYAWVVLGKVTVHYAKSGAVEFGTLPGSGQGQTERFDALFGDRIAEIRRELGREISRKEVDTSTCDIELNFRELLQLQELLQGSADEQAAGADEYTTV